MLSGTVSILRRERPRLSGEPEKPVRAETFPRFNFTHLEGDEELPKSLSPYDIVLFADGHPRVNLIKLWRALGIPDTSNSPTTSGEFFPVTCENCRAQIFEYDLDGLPGDEVLLKMETPFCENSRYLIFKFVNHDWKLLGHIDAWSKYRSSQHKIIINHGIVWLAIENQGASGSGVATYFDEVYLITPTRITRAFAYVSRGSQYGGPDNTNREFNGRVIDCSLADHKVTAKVEYSVSYVWRDMTLFSKRQTAVVVTPLGYSADWLDLTHSDLTQAELDAVYNIDSLSNEELLKYNFSELTGIATSGDVERREWLQQFLDNCEDTTERRRLKQLLAK